MDCARVEEDLIAYHFAAVSDEERDRIDAHLVECGACVRAYLALKHHTDRSGKDAPRPSDAAKQRLRDEVARTFRPSSAARARTWLARPIPLYQGLCAIAAAAVVAWFAPSVVARVIVVSDPDSVAQERIDSARPAPVSLGVY